MGKQYEPFVIPCKPTSPHVKVELVNEDGEVIHNYSFYNQEKGFEITFNEIHEDFITCYGVLNHTQKYVIINYQIFPRTSKFFFSLM